MPRRTGRALCAALLIAFPALAVGDVEFSATVDAGEVALDGSLVLRIAATYGSKGENGELQLPPFADFDVVGQPSQSEQMSFTFGGTATYQRTTITTLVLTPKRVGELAIEPVKLTLKGKSWQTDPIKVR